MPPAFLKNDDNNSFQDKPKVAPAPHMLSALLSLYQLLPLSVAELIIRIFFGHYEFGQLVKSCLSVSMVTLTRLLIYR